MEEPPHSPSPRLPRNAGPSNRRCLWRQDDHNHVQFSLEEYSEPASEEHSEEAAALGAESGSEACTVTGERTTTPNSFCGLPPLYDSIPLSSLGETGDAGEAQSFHHLLLAIAAEHRRAMEQLRLELQNPGKDGTPEREPSERPQIKKVEVRSAKSFDRISATMEVESRSDVENVDSAQLFTHSHKSSKAFFHIHSSWHNARALSAKLTRLEGRCYCRALASTQAFNGVSALMILLNSAVQGYMANEAVLAAVRGEEPQGLRHFETASSALTVYFCLELLIRVFGTGLWRCALRKEEEWTWNVFDAVIVACDLLQHTASDLPEENVNVVRMLRVFRITRTLRLVRLLRFFRELRMMIYSVIKSGSSLLWSFVLLSFTIYMFAVYFIQILSHFLEKLPEGKSESAEVVLMKEMFGSLMSAEYSLYLAVSGGISWGEISRLFIEIDPFHGLVFCAFVFFTTFAVLNIITGIFVETAVSSARNSQEELVQEQMHATKGLLEDIKGIFKGADADGDGTICLEEFQHYLGKKEMKAYLDALGIGHETAKGLFELLDMDQSGEIKLEEFIFGCLRLKGYAKSIDLASLMNHQRRMAREWRRFFKWVEGQFKKLHDFQKRVDGRLACFDPGEEEEKPSLPPSDSGAMSCAF